MSNDFRELTPPALLVLSPSSGPKDNMNQGAPPPEVRLRRVSLFPTTLFTPACDRDSLIAAYPELRQACDRIRIGSDMSLAHWCANPEWALLLLARSANPPPALPSCDWSQAVLFELIDNLIDQHHRPLRNELQRLYILVREIAFRHEEPGIEMLARSFEQLKHHLETHLDMEEVEVFPHCLAIEAAIRGHQAADHGDIDVTTGIRAMKNGHDVASEKFVEVLEHSAKCAREVSDMDLEIIRLGLCAMKADYFVHESKENEILVPAAIFAEEQLRARKDAPRSGTASSPMAVAEAAHGQ